MSTPKTLIVSHDAGGAYLLSKWCRDWFPRIDFLFYISGPAVDIFKEYIPDLNVLFSINWDEISNVITTTGWQTNFEKKAIYQAKVNKKYVVSYLDHWVNYNERFHYNDVFFYPDELWLADRYAYDIACKIFSSKNIKFRYVRNRHFSNIKHNYNKERKLIAHNFLICLEPIRDSVDMHVIYRRVYDYIRKNIDTKCELILRRHPSGESDEYEYLLDLLNKEYEVVLSNSELYEDFSTSSVVLGYQSSVLVYARLLGLESISFFPREELNPYLPDELGIQYI